jgi:membrane protein required for colicin V production
MTWPDYVIIAILALSAGFGLLRGFVREVAALLVWALAFIGSVQQSGVVSNYLTGITESPTVHLVLAFILLFVGIVVLGSIATRILVKLVTISGLGGTDRLLGLLFGAVRGSVIAALAVLLAGLSPLAQEQVWEESASLNRIKPLICLAGADSWLKDIEGRVSGDANGQVPSPFPTELPAYWAEYCARQNNPDGSPGADALEGMQQQNGSQSIRDYLPGQDG